MKELKLDVVTFLKENEIFRDENIEQLKQLVEKVLRPRGQDSCPPKKVYSKLMSPISLSRKACV